MEKKYIHVMQILDSEKTAKWQLLQQCEEQGQLVSNLKTEVCTLSLSLHCVMFLSALTHLSQKLQMGSTTCLATVSSAVLLLTLPKGQHETLFYKRYPRVLLLTH